MRKWPRGFILVLLLLIGCVKNMKTKEIYQSENMKGIISYPEVKDDSLLILLHGVGANEEGLIDVGRFLAPQSTLISLRAPLTLGSNSFAWFHVQFTANGPVHNWDEANQSFELLEKEIKLISEKFHTPLSKISVMGFSQGSIMTMGLLLRSNLHLGHYFCFSGRTLPEFADFATKNPEISSGKKVYLTHGIYDDKLPIHLGKKSKEILENLPVNLKYNEFSGTHEISKDVLLNAREWLKE